MTAIQLTGKTIVVTGAGRGIGRAIAVGAAEAGADVALVARTSGQLADVAVAVEDAGGRALVFACDVRDPAVAEQIAEETEAALGPISGLVNSAGVSTTYAPAEHVEEADWDVIVETNLLAPLQFCNVIGQRMRARGTGAIVNVASIGGVVALPRLAAYCASKGGVVGLTEALAAGWATDGVRVNCVAPAYVRTALSQDLLDHPRFGAEMLDRTPMGRFGKAEEIAAPALFLLSDDAREVTGRTICVDGGWTAH
jgi:NAD(P)-dependent dehydrogenase (short-subunit alcohol dehydrogenase family)